MVQKFVPKRSESVLFESYIGMGPNVFWFQPSWFTGEFEINDLIRLHQSQYVEGFYIDFIVTTERIFIRPIKHKSWNKSLSATLFGIGYPGGPAKRDAIKIKLGKLSEINVHENYLLIKSSGYIGNNNHCIIHQSGRDIHRIIASAVNQPKGTVDDILTGGFLSKMGEYATGIGEKIGTVSSDTGQKVEGATTGMGKTIGDTAVGLGQKVGDVTVGKTIGDTAVGLGQKVGDVTVNAGKKLGEATVGLGKTLSNIQPIQINRTIIKGDYIDDRSTVIKDSVINRSKIESKKKEEEEE